MSIVILLKTLGATTTSTGSIEPWAA